MVVPLPLAAAVLPTTQAFPFFLLPLASLGHPSFPCPQPLLCLPFLALILDSSPCFPDVSWFLLPVPPVLLRPLLSAALRRWMSGLWAPALLSLAQHLPSRAVPLPSAARTPHPTSSDLSVPPPTKPPRPGTSSQTQEACWLQEAGPTVTSSAQEEVLGLPSSLLPALQPLSSLFSCSCTESVQ